MRSGLRLARCRAGLSQKELGALLGIGRSGYGHIENGQRGLSLETALKLSKILNVPVERLFDEPRETAAG